MTMKLLGHLMRAPSRVAPMPAVDDWWAGFNAIRPAWPTPIDLCLAAGFAADRVAWAFCSGYQTALRALVPGLSWDAVAVLCASEAQGNSPKAIQTQLTGGPGAWRLTGDKTWATLGPASSQLLVVARRADADATRPVLVVARVASDASGVLLETMPPTRFVPEAPHARVHLRDAPVADADLLPGDGYESYLKPFRTIEDLHVPAAVAAYLIREARERRWPQAFVEQALATVLSLHALGGADPADSATHVALAGAIELNQALLAAADALWLACDEADAGRQRWQRDRALFQVAGTVRGLRRERAWERLLTAR